MKSSAIRSGVNGVHIKPTEHGGTIETLDVTGAFIAIGHTPNTGIFAGQLDMRDGYIIIKSGSEGARHRHQRSRRVRRWRRRRSRVSSGHHIRRIRMHGCARCGQIPRPASRTLIPPPGTRSTRAARRSCAMRSSRRSRSTGCVGAGTGWNPAPITLHDERGLAAAAPAYVKAHSFGEFVFDFSWAQAYAQHGLAYYPKLVLGVPFTPATGAAAAGAARCGCTRRRAQRADRAPSREFAAARELLVDPRAVRDRRGPRARCARPAGCRAATCSFTGPTSGYRDFDHYLEGFTAEKRKNARRERRRIVEDGLHLRNLVRPASSTRPRHRRGLRPASRHLPAPRPRALSDARLLPRAAAGARRAVHGQARAPRRTKPSPRRCSSGAPTRCTAATGAPANSSTACISRLCYHQGIEFCIERGIARFEPGTQGEHKVSRGFVPATHLVHALDRRPALPRRHRRLPAARRPRTSTNTRAKSSTHVPYRDARREARSSEQAVNKTITWLTPGRRPRMVSAARPGAR